MAESAVEVSQWRCPSCDEDVPGMLSIRVQQTSAGRERGTLTAQGRGDAGHPHCPSCGGVTRQIVTAMPTELDGSQCPTCGGSGTFQYTVSTVRLEGGTFQFTVRAAGRECTHRNVFQGLVEALRRVRKFKIGPSGFEVEVGA